MKEHCPRCRMSFRVEEPLIEGAEQLRCPDCHKIFWSAVDRSRTPHVAIVGIFPADAKRTDP